MTEGKAAEDLLDTAFDVARRYKSFGSYGSEAVAVRALHRRCPGFSKDQCRDAFHQALHLFETTSEVVTHHQEELLANWQTPERVDSGSIDAAIQQRCPGFSVSTCRSAWGWVFVWHHLR